MRSRRSFAGDTIYSWSNMTETGGIRSPEYLRALALSRLEDLMVQAIPWKEIVAILVTEGWTESESTAKKWRAEVQRKWQAEDDLTRPARKDLWRARLDAQYRALGERAKACGSDFAFAQLNAEMTRIAKVGIVLDGLASPMAMRDPSQASAAALAPHERQREIDRLLAKREAARTGGGGAN